MSSLVNSLKRQNMLLQEENERHANGLDNLASMLNEALLVLDGHDANYVANIRARLGIAQPVSAAVSPPISDAVIEEREMLLAANL
ncbi:hypothetical protein AC244_16150 [Ensifer adhaerens]|uniref:Uncharacterized protein n=1 Tax=Ensifer adhaerens TaxID=106592 RepID=A0A0L8BT57_ENSAD|nr:hypothetical protein [Ensifer adhaerens]KOF17892.1 hypothetical protein AC244_16150 [Ensifer adhaerens]